VTDRLLNGPRLALGAASTPAWRLWAQVARLSYELQPDDWLLVGGQMVALHCHLAGVTPGRVTTDIDVVANVVVTADALHACREAARALRLEPQPSVDGRRQHRFRGDDMVLDVMVPDHTPKHLVLRSPGATPFRSSAERVPCNARRCATSRRLQVQPGFRFQICKERSCSRPARGQPTPATVTDTCMTWPNSRPLSTTRSPSPISSTTRSDDR
jgi:hypothetical protein